MNAVVINCSHGYYNLGAAKLANWLRWRGDTVSEFEGDPGLFMPDANLVCLSVIFSWHAPLAVEIACREKSGAEIWAGGPGLFALGKWWKNQTGFECVRGLDQRFELQRGKYRMVFASRGCPVECWFCIVPKMEGTAFTFDSNFIPAPILCDNNLSALPVEYQELIIRRYQETAMPLVDANSGFEPRTFDGGTFERWRVLLDKRHPTMKPHPSPWRFAFDTTDEEEYVRPMMHVLRDVSASRKRVYVLIGNEPIEACYERARKVIEWGGEPYCQPVMPLNALSREQYTIRHDWTNQKLHDFARWANKWLWRSVPLPEYKPRKHEPAPFADMAVLPLFAPQP